jgi:hypothetical protein
MDDILMKFGLKTGHLITGLIAGVMGLLFNKRPQNIRQKTRSYFVVLSGAVLTGYLTPLILLKWKWLESAEYSVAFVVGLFGMGVIESIFMLISKAKTDPIGIGKAIKDFIRK